MNDKTRKAFLKLIDESERTYLALLDGDLKQGDYTKLGRAIEGARNSVEKSSVMKKVDSSLSFVEFFTNDLYINQNETNRN